MKVRSSPRTGGMVMELGRRETALPAVPLAEIQLKRILVPVDFSACSSKALRYAVSFARQFNAEIMLLHVVQPVVYSEPAMVAVTAFDDTAFSEAAAKQLAGWRKRITSVATVKAHVRTGTPYYEIVRAAEETNTDLIVIGTHGRTGLTRLLIGGTAERVVRYAPCPVMVIREREHDFIDESERAATKTTQLKGGRYGDSSKEKRSRKSTAVLRR